MRQVLGRDQDQDRGTRCEVVITMSTGHAIGAYPVINQVGI